MVLKGGYLRRFLSPSEYPSGRVAGVWACVYLALTVLVIVSAVPEGNGDGAFTVDLAFLATLPLSFGVLAIQGDGAWMLADFAVCAFVNTFVLWVVFRGSAHYPRHDRTPRVAAAARRKGRLSKHARKELGDSLHPRKHV
jgi:hypothetical protein